MKKIIICLISIFTFVSCLSGNFVYAKEDMAKVKGASVKLPFTDVSKYKWYYSTVAEAYELGLMSGTSETTFSPEDNMTRGMLVSVIHRIANEPSVKYSGKFTDVPEKSYCSLAVEWAAKNKVVSGYADGKFGPNDYISRQDVAVILYNFTKSLGLDVSNDTDLSKYKDYKNVSSYAADAMKWAISKDILSGAIDIKSGILVLNPKDNATRAQCAKMLLNGKKVVKDKIEYDKFKGKIGVYESKNLPTTSDYYEDRCPAWMGVYVVDKNINHEVKIRDEFRKVFGYVPLANVECKFIGDYKVDGYDKPQSIYQYTITDSTYPLLLDDFYEIKRKICDDGSPWVGFSMPGNVWTMEKSERIDKLVDEVNKEFCDWSGYDMEYMLEHEDQFYVNYISNAGFYRTKDGKVLEIVYRYTRGVNVKVKE